jgi:hypothetical protein
MWNSPRRRHNRQRPVNLLVYSLSLHRYSYIGFILVFASSIHNKQQQTELIKRQISQWGLKKPNIFSNRLSITSLSLLYRPLGFSTPTGKILRVDSHVVSLQICVWFCKSFRQNQSHWPLKYSRQHEGSHQRFQYDTHLTQIVYYESIKREVKTRPIYECRCDERLKTKTEKSTCLPYTGFHGELEHLKIKTRLIDEMFVSVMGEYVSLKW